MVARAIPWLFPFDALLIVGAVAGAISLARFRARLSADEARRLTGIVSYRQVHRQLVRGRRLLIASAAIVTGGVLSVFFTVGLDPVVMEFFTVVVLAGFYAPFYVAASLFEGAFGMIADRVDELAKQTSKKPPNRPENERLPGPLSGA